VFWLKFLSKFITLLHSENEPRHLAAGFALGAIIGLTPMMSLHNLAVFLIILLFDTSIPAAFFAIFLFSGFAYLLDPFFHRLGYYLLVEVEALRPFWTTLYNIPIAPLTRFYNTVVLGSFVIAILGQLPLYFGFKALVKFYRTRYADKIQQLKLVQFIKGSNMVQFYYKIKSTGVKL